MLGARRGCCQPGTGLLAPLLTLRRQLLEEGLLLEVEDVARRYADRADLDKIPCTSVWTAQQQPGVPTSRVSPGPSATPAQSPTPAEAAAPQSA